MYNHIITFISRPVDNSQHLRFECTIREYPLRPNTSVLGQAIVQSLLDDNIVATGTNDTSGMKLDVECMCVFLLL